jgi:hypothetical protein
MWWDYNYYLAEKQIATMEGDIAICQEFSNYEQGQKSRGKDIDNLAISNGAADRFLDDQEFVQLRTCRDRDPRLERGGPQGANL